MQIETTSWSNQSGWAGEIPAAHSRDALAIVTGTAAAAHHPLRPIQQFLTSWKGNAVVGGSAERQFRESGVDDDLVITVLRFEHVQVRAATADLHGAGGSRQAGRELGVKLARVNVGGVVLFIAPDSPSEQACQSDALIAGLGEVLPGVPIVGALACGHADLQPWVVNDSTVVHSGAVAVALLGDSLRFGYGTASGWQAFGPERKVTRAANAVVIELDRRRPADIYRQFLGEAPANGDLSPQIFPLTLCTEDEPKTLISVRGVDPTNGSLLLDDRVGEDSVVRLMRASNERLVDAARLAALKASTGYEQVAICIGGAGRPHTLRSRADDEAAAIVESLAEGIVLHGLYAAGELAPIAGRCHRIQQSMTVVAIGEDISQPDGTIDAGAAHAEGDEPL